MFTIFDPYPPPAGSFLLPAVGKFGKILTSPPLKTADILKMDGPLVKWQEISALLTRYASYLVDKNFLYFNQRGQIMPTI